MHQKKDDYYIGLLYCIRNDIEKAYFYLNRAAIKGNKVAKKTLKELEEKNFLTNCIKEANITNVS